MDLRVVVVTSRWMVMEAMRHSIGDLALKLASLLKLRSIPFGMKLFERRAEMEAIPKVRRPSIFTLLIRLLRKPRGLDGRWALPPKIWSVRNVVRSWGLDRQKMPTGIPASI